MLILKGSRVRTGEVALYSAFSVIEFESFQANTCLSSPHERRIVFGY